MRKLIVAGVILAALAGGPHAYAQALPDTVRNAGVTVAQWSAVQAEVRRAAAARGASERALAAVAARVSANLVQNGRIDFDALLASIDDRATQVAELQTQLAAMQAAADPTVAKLLADARAAIDAGDLTGGDALLAKAAESDLAGIARDRARLEARQTRAAATLGERGRLAFVGADYLGAAALHAKAAETAPETNTEAKWQHRMDQAEALRTRGELFAEPLALRKAVQIYSSDALPLAPFESRREAWGDTQNDLGLAFLALGNLGETSDLRQAVSHLIDAGRARSRETDPVKWADTKNNLAIALMAVGQRIDDVGAFRAAIPHLLDAWDIYLKRGMLKRAQDASLNSSLLMISIGSRNADPAMLSNAATQTAKIIEQMDKKSDPGAWSRAQTILCSATQLLAIRERATDWPSRAVAACAEASASVDATRDPFRKTQLEMLLGLSEAVLGEREHDVPTLRRAADRLQRALSATQPSTAPVPWANAQLALAAAHATIADESSDASSARDSLRSAEAALAVLDGSEATLITGIQTVMVFALVTEAKHTSSPTLKRQLIDRALGMCVALVPRVPKDQDPVRWAVLRYHYSGALLQKGQINRSLTDLQHALSELEDAAVIAQQSGSSYYADRIDRRRAEIQAAIAAEQQ
jgi:hypothetical protein